MAIETMRNYTNNRNTHDSIRFDQMRPTSDLIMINNNNNEPILFGSKEDWIFISKTI